MGEKYAEEGKGPGVVHITSHHSVTPAADSQGRMFLYLFFDTFSGFRPSLRSRMF